MLLTVSLQFSLLILLLDAFACRIGSSFLNKVLLFFLLVLFNHLELLLPGFIKHGEGRLIDARLELGEKFEQLQHHDSLGQYLWVFRIAEVIVQLDLDAAGSAEVTGVHLVLNHKIFNGVIATYRFDSMSQSNSCKTHRDLGELRVRDTHVSWESTAILL